jgi:hypothetical protein
MSTKKHGKNNENKPLDNALEMLADLIADKHLKVLAGEIAVISSFEIKLLSKINNDKVNTERKS